MADLRFRFIEDYAGGLLNISRQEVSTTGEVLSQDGLTSEGTIFVEDGSGVKSGLKLGVSLAEAIDPTTEMGIVNVRYADRTYAKVRDLRIFTTAIASAQSALSEATSTSISNLETAFQLLEDDITSIEENLQSNITTDRENIQTLTINQNELTDRVNVHGIDIQTLSSRISALENYTPEQKTKKVNTLSLDQNKIYYPGTISISAGVVTGTTTTFSEDLAIGDIFVATDSTGDEVEFKVASFDTTTPGIKMSVTPTNKTVNAGSKYKRSIDRTILQKVNEIIFALKDLNIFV